MASHEQEFGHLNSHPLTEVEQLLRTYTPDPGGLSPGLLMFRLGQESVRQAVARSRRRTTQLWSAATAVLTAAAAGLGILLAPTPQPQVIEREKIVYVQRPNSETPSDRLPSASPTAVGTEKGEAALATQGSQQDLPGPYRPYSPPMRAVRPEAPSPQFNYLAARKMALTQGVESLPRLNFEGSSSPPGSTYGELHRELLAQRAIRRTQPSGWSWLNWTNPLHRGENL